MEGDKKNTDTKMAGINKSASKHFQMAYDIARAMKNCPIPETELKKLQANLHFNLCMHKTEAMDRMAKTHLVNVDEEILKGHMGYAVSYLRIAKGEIESMTVKKGDYDYLNNDQKAEFANRSKIINNNYDNCLLKNQKVYKQKEFLPEQLPDIPEDATAITAMEPKDIKAKVGTESKFECFLSPEILSLKSDFMN
jgi:hypothetical protein